MTHPAVILLLSGGMDSMVCADLLRSERFRVLPLFVDYGQPAARKELEAARSFARIRGLILATERLVDFYALSRASRIPGATPRKAFIPGRNLMLLTIASVVARSRRASFVAIGAIGDRSFSDTSDSLFRMFGAIAPMAFDHEVSVVTPLVHSSKAGVVAIAKKLGTPLDVSYSCYRGRARPCGKCLACKARRSVLV